MLDELNEEKIAAALTVPRVHVFAEVGSTNDEALALLSAGAPAWTVVVADRQTAGRGRMGRRWLTPAGQALAVSVVLRPAVPPASLPRLTMLGAVAVLRALGRWFAPEALGLKWPNDALLEGRKVAGILPEGRFLGARLEGAVLGVGLNVHTRFDAYPELAARATSMAQAAPGREFDRVEVLAALVEELQAAYPHLEDAALFAAWRDALVTLGRTVTIGGVRGAAEAVQPDGALLLRDGGGKMHRVRAEDA